MRTSSLIVRKTFRILSACFTKRNTGSIICSILNQNLGDVFKLFPGGTIDYHYNNGLEGTPPQWVLVNHGHEAALDDGDRDGKLL